MQRHPFLSPEWVEAARALQEDFQAEQQLGSTVLRMNLVVDEVPFGPSRIDAHLDTSDGRLDIGPEHLDGADVKVSLDYATAKAILIDGDSQAGMAAFMAGKVRVEGDMTKLLTFQATPPSERQSEVSEALRAITE